VSVLFKNLGTPDETVRFSGIVQSTVELGDLTVARTVLEPGWRWANDVRPTVGGQWCQARHLGTVLSGAFAVEFADGTRTDLHAGDVYDIQPGHDGYTLGDEPCTLIEWAGTRAFSGFRIGMARRQLVTLLVTDVVDSTSMVRQIGDGAWRDLLSSHLEMARAQLERFGGREVNTTGDGLLATFDSPARAVQCAASISERSGRLQVRAGVHVGEVEPVGGDVRGVAVHEVARIAGEAGPGEVLVSETTRALTVGGTFVSRGVHDLKGIGAMALYAYERSADASGS
jgi:class 3 adenylate cyclase